MAARTASHAVRASTSALPASRAHASGSARVSDAPAPAPSASVSAPAPLPSRAAAQPENVQASLGADPAAAATVIRGPGPSRTSWILHKVTGGRMGQAAPAAAPGQTGDSEINLPNKGFVSAKYQAAAKAAMMAQRPGLVSNVFDKLERPPSRPRRTRVPPTLPVRAGQLSLPAPESSALALAEPSSTTPARIETHRTGRHRRQKLSTAAFKIGPKKLDLLSRLIRRRPIGDALVQLQFSDKRAARRVKSMVALAQQHAVQYQGLDPRKLVVDETWVTKGKRLRRLDIKAKAGRGIKHHPSARLHVVLREGPSVEETKRRKLEREFRIRLRTGATPFLNESRPIHANHHAGPGYRW